MSGYLPCGVTDSMCDVYDPICGGCGHPYSDHYETDDELNLMQFDYKKNHIEELLNENGGQECGQMEYRADGSVSHACDCTYGKTQEEKIKNQCECEEFSDEPYEPELEWDYDD